VTDGEGVSESDGSGIESVLPCGLPTAGREALNLEVFESMLGGGKGSAGWVPIVEDKDKVEVEGALFSRLGGIV